MDKETNLPAESSSLPVAVDTTGGDKGIEVQVEGAIQAYRDFGAKSTLVGPQTELESLLESLGAKDTPIDVCHASQTIEMDETPSRAVLKKPDSSLCVAYRLVSEGKASSVLSSGNSGAMMAAGIMLSGLMPGIQRPAIATIIPAAGEGTPNVVLDSGANVDVDAHNLVQFAVMGGIYYSSLFTEQNPRVALLSNGSEPSKGTDTLRAAARELTDSERINYVGYVEGRDVAGDLTDVIVCDGFVGNVLLKTMEGCVRLVAEQLMHEGQRSLFNRVGMGLSRNVFRKVFREKFDHAAYGGAPLLGLKNLAIVLHGSSDSRSVKNAIKVADTFARIKMIDKLASELSALEDDELDTMDEVVTSVIPKNGKFDKKERGNNG